MNQPLSAEVAAAQKRHPGWHLWLDSGGRVNATTTVSLYDGSGTTLDAPTAKQAEHEIAVFERRAQKAAA